MASTVNRCRQRLALVWFIGSGIAFFILIVQTMGGKYAEEVTQVWDWFLPNIVPTLTLMVGTFITQAAGKASRTLSVNHFLYHLALWLSVVYLLVLLLPILSLPFVCTEPERMIGFLKQSGLWLTPLQGLVSASLGGFFVSGTAN
jgi:hypothetical protein